MTIRDVLADAIAESIDRRQGEDLGPVTVADLELADDLLLSFEIVPRRP